MDVVEVRDVVAAVAQRARVERQQPDAVDADLLQVVELVGEPAEVAGAVVVAVVEAAQVDLVEDRRLEPLRLALEPVPGLAHSGHLHDVAAARRQLDVVAAGAPRERRRRVSSSRASNAGGKPSATGITHDACLRRMRVDVDDADDIILGVGDELRRSPSRASGCCRPRCSAGSARRTRSARATSGSSGPSSDALLRLVLLRVEVLLRARRAPARSRTTRSPSRCRRSATASPRARAAPRTPAARRAAGTRGGCPACSRTRSAGRTATTRRAARMYSRELRLRVLPREVRVATARSRASRASSSSTGA